MEKFGRARNPVRKRRTAWLYGAGAVFCLVLLLFGVCCINGCSGTGSVPSNRETNGGLVRFVESKISSAVENVANKTSQTKPSVEKVVVTAEEIPVQNRTCVIARYGDVEIHSPIMNRDLTGVLFHQASYAYGLVMTTAMPQADAETISPETGIRINREQHDGNEWLDADALHLYRYQDSTAMDTSIDVGAPVGTPVYAPVDGTVVLVKDYLLYGYVPDIEIHIQPDGHPELDVVLLHQYDPVVSPGQHVSAGETPLSKVRDIAADLSDIQLGYYTMGDDPGNHSHVQVNDVMWPDYYRDKLFAFGAFVTPERVAINEETRIAVTQAEIEQAVMEQTEQEATSS